MDGAAGRWWQGATLYQIYVRSWRDSDGDGSGDLRGVIAGLDYLQWLGVDGIWLSPTMPSPDQDWGYDVSGYLGVHHDLGTMADMDRLVAEAGQRGIRVLLDLVPNHTSSAHPWFIDARSGRDSEHRDYYVWADPDADGQPPNNWKDTTGASAWTFDDASGQFYLHNFLPSQPDLNWWDTRVHEEFGRILKFWFDRGIAGVRIDVAHGLYKDALLRDNPPSAGVSWQDGAYGRRAVYSANRPETHAVYRDWRRLAESYSSPRLLLGETWVGELDRMASYYGHDDELQLAFNFPFLFAEFTAPALSRVVSQTLAALPPGACPVWGASNHDVGRFPTRWCGGDERTARLALLLLATLPGTLVLYYGDEIVMTDVAVPPALRRDQMTEHLAAKGRDRARTPMQWDSSPSAGFTSDLVRPWLPYGDNMGRNVASERNDPRSTLHLCRDLLTVRRAELGGRIASYEQLDSPPGVWTYRADKLLVAGNLSGRSVKINGPVGTVLLATDALPDTGTGEVTLGPWQGVIAWPR